LQVTAVARAPGCAAEHREKIVARVRGGFGSRGSADAARWHHARAGARSTGNERAAVIAGLAPAVTRTTLGRWRAEARVIADQ
jgi:hypothetical protein